MVEIVADTDEGVTLPAHASYSALRSWLACQEKWWLTKMDPNIPPSRPGFALVGGSAVHLVSERWESEYCQLEAA